MKDSLKRSIWNQYGAALDMLKFAIDSCPPALWTIALWTDEDDAMYGQFWFIAYHTLFWADLYLTGSIEGFAPPKPFIRGKLPEKPYTKDEVLTYFAYCRQHCQTTILELTDEKADQICKFEWMQPTFLELQIYSMRHVQEHAAHLNLILGMNGVTGQDWIAQAKDDAS